MLDKGILHYVTSLTMILITSLGVDWVQERMGGGSQTNGKIWCYFYLILVSNLLSENAMEQMKDEQISVNMHRIYIYMLLTGTVGRNSSRLQVYDWTRYSYSRQIDVMSNNEYITDELSKSKERSK